MTAISFGGLASGLDTTAIINALVGAKEIPINMIGAKKNTANSKLSLVSTLKGLVQSVQDKAKEMQDLAGFLTHQITPSEEGVANFTVTGTPISGSHTLIVNSLATSEKVASAGMLDSTTPLDDGTISFTYNGELKSITIDPLNSSLDDIAEAINESLGSMADAVEATVINTGTTSAPSYELVLSGKDSGADYALSGLSVSGNLANSLSFGPPLVQASNAEIVIDGLTVERETNDFSDVIPGLTIEAISADPAKEISFGVSVDQDDIKKKLGEFVETYNAVMGFLNAQNSFNAEDGASSDLFGDHLLSTVRDKMYKGFVQADLAAVTADTEGYSALSLIGIKLTVDGTLEMDETKVADKMSADINAFSDFFSAEGTGAFGKLSASLDYLLDSTGEDVNGAPLDGLFEIRSDSISANIEDYQSSIDKMKLAVDKYQEGLVAKFSNLELVMAKLQSMGAAVDNLGGLDFG